MLRYEIGFVWPYYIVILMSLMESTQIVPCADEFGLAKSVDEGGNEVIWYRYLSQLPLRSQ